MEKIEFILKYDGPALASHEMDVKDLAPALLSLGELLEEANRLFNGDKAKLAVKIKATEEGSVEVCLSAVQDILGQASNLFGAGAGALGVIDTVSILKHVGIIKNSDGGLFGLLKWLKGRNIKSVVRLEANNFKLELEDGEARVFNDESIRLFGLYSARRKTEAIIRGPLSKQGIDQVTFSSSDPAVVDVEATVITKDEAQSFAVPEIPEEILDESEIETNLQIINISFQDDGKWKFSDGNSVFFAEILDREFLDKVTQNQEFFAKDDILKVTMRRKQYLSSGQFKTEYSVVKVLDHRSAAIQIKLPFVS